MITADTITDEQIRELLCEAERECRTPHIRTFSINFHPFSKQLICANWAIGRFEVDGEDWYLDDAGHMHYLHGRYANREECTRNGRAGLVEIINARAKEQR